MRYEIEGRVKEHEKGLKADVAAAKSLSVATAIEAAEFKQPALWGNTADPNLQPLFTKSEIAEIEKRIENTSDSKESRKLSSILENSAKEHAETFDEVLSKVFTPELEVQTIVERASAAPEKSIRSDERARSNSREIGIGVERLSVVGIYRVNHIIGLRKTKSSGLSAGPMNKSKLGEMLISSRK